MLRKQNPLSPGRGDERGEANPVLYHPDCIAEEGEIKSLEFLWCQMFFSPDTL